LQEVRNGEKVPRRYQSRSADERRRANSGSAPAGQTAGDLVSSGQKRRADLERAVEAWRIRGACRATTMSGGSQTAATTRRGTLAPAQRDGLARDAGVAPKDVAEIGDAFFRAPPGTADDA
jgi:hypothetical protein